MVLVPDEEYMNPHEVVEHPACRWVLDALAFLVWKGGRMLLRAVRIRYSRAAYTSKQTVITINSAMMRSGFSREREDAENCGAFRKRNPRSARACPL